jgi:hypothetical protein
VALLLAAFVSMALLGSRQKSGSFDEQYHLAAGYAYLKTGDFRMATTHPPLVALLAALPLARESAIQLPLDGEAWQSGGRYAFAEEFLWRANAERARAMLEAARVPVILMGAGIVLAVFLWGKALLGLWGALLAATLVAFDPNLIAHSRQVTTDVGVTLFVLLTLWALWRWLERGGWVALLLAGICAGLAMGAKYSGLFLWPAALLVLLLHPAVAGRGTVRRLGALAAMGALAALTLWALYRFDGGWVEAAGLRVWLPLRFYLVHLIETLGGLLETARPNFLLGQISAEGWWSYFPVAIGVKTPLPTLLLLAAGVVALVRLGSGAVRRQAALWAPALLLLALALTGFVTIGYRHMLPALPLAVLLAGNSVRWVRPPERIWPVGALAAAVASLVVGTLVQFPHHDSAFNLLAGRWQNWSNILVDSNLDWGQDLPALAALQEEMGIEQLNLAYFGHAVPELYGVRYSPLPGFLRFVGGREASAYNPAHPEPGWYAISATSLRLGLFTMEETELYAAFREMKPVARAGYSMALYYIAPEPERRPPLLVTGEPAWRLPAFAPGSDEGPVQVKWRQHENSAIVPAGVDLPPLPGDPAATFAAEADLGGVFTLERVALERATVRPGDTVRGVAVWRRGEAIMPMPAPTRGEAISAFFHLVAADDPERRVAQYDGWEVALRGLEPGDRVVQNLELTLAADAPPGDYRLLAGLYSPQDGQRLTLTTPPPDAPAPVDAVDLGALTVTP